MSVIALSEMHCYFHSGLLQAELLAKLNIAEVHGDTVVRRVTESFPEWSPMSIRSHYLRKSLFSLSVLVLFANLVGQKPEVILPGL